MTKILALAAGALTMTAGTFGTADALSICQVSGASHALPSSVKESSGLARSMRDPGVFWTHNDAGNDPVLFAVSSDGRLRNQVRVTGASQQDWEDIAAAPCGGSNCLFVGDIGDNSEKRPSISIYRIPEPAANASTAGSPVALQARYPNGPRDAEAMFIVSGNIYIVTKGRKGPVELYRYPRGATGTATLESVRQIFPAPRSSSDRVTSASASPDGKWVGIRTYRTLYLYRADELVSATAKQQPIEIDLAPLKEFKGEGLAVANDGSVWLSSEAGKKEPPRLAFLKCSLPVQSS